MRKKKLELDALTVDTFDTQAAPDGGGTVKGAELTVPLCSQDGGYTCGENTCEPPSCPAFSCVSQCPAKC